MLHVCLYNIIADDDLQSNHEGEMAVVPVAQNQALVPKQPPAMPKPKWHPPWKLYRVISGHLGWVRSVAVEPGNEWFATGSADRVIKVIYQKF